MLAKAVILSEGSTGEGSASKFIQVVSCFTHRILKLKGTRKHTGKEININAKFIRILQRNGVYICI